MITEKNKQKKKVFKKSSTMAFLEGVMGEVLTIGSMLRAQREAEELTLAQMGEILGLSRQQLSDIEKGRRAVSIQKAASFAKALELHEGHWVKVAIEESLRTAGLAETIKIEAA